jgi:hypothetical protein
MTGYGYIEVATVALGPVLESIQLRPPDTQMTGVRCGPTELRPATPTAGARIAHLTSKGPIERSGCRGHDAKTNVACGAVWCVSAARSDPVAQAIALVAQVRTAPHHTCRALIGAVGVNVG